VVIRPALAIGLVLGGFVAGAIATWLFLAEFLTGDNRPDVLDHPDREAAEFGVALVNEPGGGWQS
jgi:hypothetical protein